MRTGRRVTALVTALAVAATSTGCGTIVHGSRQNVKVRSTPSGVTVTTADRQTVTPGELQDLKRDRDHKVFFEKDGLPPWEIMLVSTPSWWLLGNVLLGGLFGLIVDFATGSGYRLKPNNLEVDMMTGTVKEFED